jgi:hypothetical protein
MTNRTSAPRLRRKRPQSGCLVALGLLLAFSTPPGAANAADGLTAGQRSVLHSFGFAVLPDPVPPGYAISSVHIDSRQRSYTVVYTLVGGRTTLKFSGIANGRGGSEPHESFFKRLGRSIGGIGKKSGEVTTALRSSSTENVTPVQEQELSNVSADSTLAGPIHFNLQGKCLTGQPDSGKAIITTARFTIIGCYLKRPDPLIHAYHSVARL